MRIKHLLLTAIALPLLFVACKQNDPVDEVKNPTIELTAGEATTDSLSFTITTTEAENAAWLAVKTTELGSLVTSEVLATGTAVEVNKTVECKATNLEDGTEYTIVAAVKNSKGADKKEIKMTTIAADPEATAFKLKSASEVEFDAEGGNGEIEYEVVNPVEGTEVEAEADAEWISDVTVAEKISYTVAKNEGEAREGKVIASYGDLKFEVKVKQAAKKNEEPEPEPEPDTVEFTATVADIQYYGTDYSVAYNYLVYLSDVGLNENGTYQQNGVYYMLDLYAADSVEISEGYLPNGTYKAAENYAAGTFSIGDYGANITMVDGAPSYNLYTGGTVVVSDGKIEATFEMEDGKKHHVVFEGDLKFMNTGNEPQEPADVVLTAENWTWGGSSSYGNKYSVSGEGFSLDVHFPAQYASEAALAEGEYIWTNTSWWGYNDFDNEFTTRSFLVDGAYASIVKEGSAVVAVEGDVYTIKLTLKAEDTSYSIEYNGKLADNSQGGGDAEPVVFTACEFVGYNSSYWFYEYKFTNEAGDKFNLCVNDNQANETMIYTDDTYEWISISMCGNLGYFSTRNMTIGGSSVTAKSGGMVVETDEATKHMDITVTLTTTTGAQQVLTFSGKVGDTLGGGEEPVEPTALATPTATATVAGNVVTLNWNAVDGAANYGVTLNGDETKTENTSIEFTLDYATDYTFTVVAYPADNAAHTASAAATVTATTEADPNEGGNEGGDTASFENWVFTASVSSFLANSTLTFTDGSHTVTCKFNTIAEYIYAGDTDGYSYAYDFTVNGVAVDIAKVSGTIRLSFSDYKMTLDLVIDGVKYTGTSTNAVA